jgi:hypothetical protein
MMDRYSDCQESVKYRSKNGAQTLAEPILTFGDHYCGREQAASVLMTIKNTEVVDDQCAVEENLSAYGRVYPIAIKLMLALLV